MPSAHLRLRVAVGGFAGFLAALAALHLLNYGRNPWHMSEFVFGRDAWLWDLGILGLTAALACLASVLRESFPKVRDVRLCSNLLWAAAAMVLVLEVFPTDPAPWPTTARGYLHVLAAIASITLQAIVMLVLVDAGRRDPRLGEVTGTSFAWPAVAMAIGFLWGFSDGLDWPISPLVQRVMSVLMVAWLARLALRLQAALATGSGPHGAADPADG
jgi:hypothetical protein